MTLPIFPLGTVLFPDGRLDLRIFEQRYVDMTRACLRDESEFGVCLILDGREAGEPAVPHPVGCSAKIEVCEVPAPGLFRLVCRGMRTFEIQSSTVRSDGLREAQVRWLEQVDDVDLPAAHQGLKSIYNTVLGTLGAEVFLPPHRPDRAAWLCHRIAEFALRSAAARQQLLQTPDPLDKLELVTRSLKAAASIRADGSAPPG